MTDSVFPPDADQCQVQIQSQTDNIVTDYTQIIDKDMIDNGMIDTDWKKEDKILTENMMNSLIILLIINRCLW